MTDEPERRDAEGIADVSVPLPSPPASSPAIRRTMQANRSRDTGPELELRRLLRAAGHAGYRLHWKKAPGRPDIAYAGRRIAIFVNGCFWHRCPHCQPPTPKSNSEFWLAKFKTNQERDARKSNELQAAGWTVLTVWECEIASRPEAVIAAIVGVLDGARRASETYPRVHAPVSSRAASRRTPPAMISTVAADS